MRRGSGGCWPGWFGRRYDNSWESLEWILRMGRGNLKGSSGCSVKDESKRPTIKGAVYCGNTCRPTKGE